MMESSRRFEGFAAGGFMYGLRPASSLHQPALATSAGGIPHNRWKTGASLVAALTGVADRLGRSKRNPLFRLKQAHRA
jgi:hypothetical protein